MQTRIVIRVLKVILWIVGLYAAAQYSFHSLYFIISGFYWMFTNLGKRKEGTLSAYSVFNDNCERIHGTMDGTEMFRGGLKEQKRDLVIEKSQSDKIDENVDREQYFKNQSKYGNKPCFCGSTQKFKKCCLPTERKRLEEERLKRIKAS